MADQGIFGDKPFGDGEFGLVNWAERVIWQNVPAKHRDLDVREELKKLLAAFQGELDAFRALIRDLPSQRDPYECRGQDELEEWFYVVQCVEADTEDYGRVVKLIGESSWDALPNTGPPIVPPPSPEPGWYPYRELSRVGPHWTMNLNGVTYKVVLVQTRNFSQSFYPMTGNEVWLTGGPAIATQTSFTDQIIGRGDDTASPEVMIPDETFRITRNDETTPAIGTAGISVTLELDLAGIVTVYDNGIGELREDSGGQATGPQHGTVDYDSGRVWISATGGNVVVSGTEILATFDTAGRMVTFKPTSMLVPLAKDFGLETDLNDPEAVQRSVIANVTKYMGLKATQASYRIRGEISGFNVYARPLYRILDSSLWAQLPASHNFVYGGRLYTDIEPRFLRFDDISGDVEYWDEDAAPPQFVPLTDDALMYEDISPDGMSTALAFSIDVTQNGVTVLSATPITDPVELETYGLVNGFEVVVEFVNASDFDVFSFTPGVFGLTSGYPAKLSDPVFWIDAAKSWNPGTRRWTIVMGGDTAIALGAAALRYFPEVEQNDCSFCRSNKLRIEIEPTDAAWDHYGHGDGMSRAVDRMIDKIDKLLIPIHAEVMEYVFLVETTVLGPAVRVSGLISYP